MSPTPKIQINHVAVEKILDPNADTSHIGEYTDQASPECIERRSGEYIGDIERRREIDKIESTGETELSPKLSREYSYFRPYAGGEQWPSADYRKYGHQDFHQMEQLQRGEWSFVGIVATATILVPNNNGSKTIQTIHSGGLLGIEDSTDDYIDQIAAEELENLADQLRAIGLGKRAIDYAISRWNGEYVEK